MEIKRIHIRDITPDPDQPRKIKDQKKIALLAQSIRKIGVHNAIHIRLTPPDSPVKTKYMIINGERRFLASQEAGKKTIPAIIKKHSSYVDLIVDQIMDNVAREDMGIIDTITAYKKALDAGVDINELAASCGKTVATIEEDLKILALKPTLQSLVDNGGLTKTVARKLAEIDPKKQRRAWKNHAAKKKTTKEQIRAIDAYIAQTQQQTISSVFEFDTEELPPEIKRESKKFLCQLLNFTKMAKSHPVSERPAMVVFYNKKKTKQIRETAAFLSGLAAELEEATTSII